MTDSPSQALPPVPTTRILAIGKFSTPPTIDTLQQLMPSEVTQTAQLYLNGKIEQWFSRQDESGVVFLLNVVDLEEARVLLEALPLGQAGLMSFDLIPLGPLKPLRFLLKALSPGV